MESKRVVCGSLGMSCGFCGLQLQLELIQYGGDGPSGCVHSFFQPRKKLRKKLSNRSYQLAKKSRNNLNFCQEQPLLLPKIYKKILHRFMLQVKLFTILLIAKRKKMVPKMWCKSPCFINENDAGIWSLILDPSLIELMVQTKSHPKRLLDTWRTIPVSK